MNKAAKLRAKLLSGKGYHNFSFADLGALLAGFGFILDRQDGTSHQVWKHPAIPTALMNVQAVHGKAKPYQLRQLRDIVREHNL